MTGVDRGIFTGRCPLCGAHTSGGYCHAHSWAGPTKPARTEPPPPPPLDELARARIWRDGFRAGYRRQEAAS